MKILLIVCTYFTYFEGYAQNIDSLWNQLEKNPFCRTSLLSDVGEGYKPIEGVSEIRKAYKE